MEIKEAIKRDTGLYAGGLVMYSFLMAICYDGYYALQQWLLSKKHPSFSHTEVVDMAKGMVTRSGTPYLISVVIGLLFLRKFYEDQRREDLFCSHKRMKVSRFLMIFCVFMGIQLLFTLFGEIFELILNSMHLSAAEQIKTASKASTTISMFLYTSIAAPITEELIFRGYLLKGLKRYGKCIAILTSALFFGAFHANFVQGLYAFGIGLVLGYVAMEYSIYWAILLHILNNLVFCESVSFILKGWSNQVQSQVTNGIDLFFFLLGGVVLFCNRRRIRKYLFYNRTLSYWEVYRSGWFLIYLGLMFLMACAGITRL